MSTTTQSVERLALNAGKYLGKEAGEKIDANELIEQGVANGYSQKEVQNWLRRAHGSVDEVRVPSQGDTLGSLWNPSTETTDGSDDPDGNASGTLQVFRNWCEERASAEEDHTYTRRRANRRFARGKDVDRRFVRENDVFSTVLITYTLPREADESLVEHANRFYPRAITQRRRRILKKAGVYEGMAGVSIFAPKRPEDSENRVPDPSGLTTHCHDFLWLPGRADESDFDRLHKVDDFDIDVSVRAHVSSEVKSPEAVSEIDRQRGDTTALPQELGANLPLLNCKFDARGAPEYIERWSAAMRLGRDESINTAGFRRVRKLGAFDELASAERQRRQIEEAVGQATALESELEHLRPSPTNTQSESEPASEFHERSEGYPETATADTSESEEHDHGSDRVPDAFTFKYEADGESPEGTQANDGMDFDFSSVSKKARFTFQESA